MGLRAVTLPIILVLIASAIRTSILVKPAARLPDEERSSADHCGGKDVPAVADGADQRWILRNTALTRANNSR
jgi:hypothetical protein